MHVGDVLRAEWSSSIWRSLWDASADPDVDRPHLSGPIDTEIAIVGGGVEGLALARELAMRGRRPVLLEAAAIGSGATGASAGVIAPQPPRNTPEGIRKALGREAGDRYLSLLAGSGRETFALIGDRLQAAGGNPTGFLAPAIGARGAARIATTIDQWRAIRPDLRAIDAEETARLTGAAGYGGAILDPTGGSVNPLAYARMLAGDAEEAGASIYPHSMVTKLQRVENGWHLQLADATVRARTVVLCGNGGSPALHPRLSRSILPLTICQIATEPLPAALRERILPFGHAMTDMETEVFSIRYDPAGRLITAHPMAAKLADPGRLQAAINARLGARLPDWQFVPLQFAWTGTAWINSNLLPRIAEVDEGLFAVQACNGRGIALAAVVARSFSRWLLSDRTEPCDMPIGAPRPIPGYVFARYLPGIVMKASLVARRMTTVFSRG